MADFTRGYTPLPLRGKKGEPAGTVVHADTLAGEPAVGPGAGSMSEGAGGPLASCSLLVQAPALVAFTPQSRGSEKTLSQGG